MFRCVQARFTCWKVGIFEPSISGASDSISVSSCTQQRANASKVSTALTISNCLR